MAQKELKGVGGPPTGGNCNYFHPILCKSLIKSRTWFNAECTFPHLKGMERDREKQAAGNIKRVPKHTYDNPKSTASSQHSYAQNHLFESKSMTQAMNSRFEEELQAVKNNISRQQV